MTDVVIAGRPVGPGHPAYVIAEIGINHNGSIDIAKQLVDVAAVAGCDAVKFQKRTPELCVPAEQRDLMRETPWGVMTYLEYKERIEFGDDEFAEIDRYCGERGITWFASCWDPPSVDFIEQFDPACHKIASATITDDTLVDRLAKTERPLVLSTGMSTMDEIRHAVERLPRERLLIAHSTSTYPCGPEELNLRMLATLAEEFDCPVGYSGHEVGLQTTVAAVALGRVLRGAAHHPRSGDVGNRPGRVGRTGRLAPTRARHPHRRVGPGRRREARLRQRAAVTGEAAGRFGRLTHSHKARSAGPWAPMSIASARRPSSVEHRRIGRLRDELGDLRDIREHDRGVADIVLDVGPHYTVGWRRNRSFAQPNRSITLTRPADPGTASFSSSGSVWLDHTLTPRNQRRSLRCPDSRRGP